VAYELELQPAYWSRLIGCKYQVCGLQVRGGSEVLDGLEWKVAKGVHYPVVDSALGSAM